MLIMLKKSNDDDDDANDDLMTDGRFTILISADEIVFIKFYLSRSRMITKSTDTSIIDFSIQFMI